MGLPFPRKEAIMQTQSELPKRFGSKWMSPAEAALYLKVSKNWLDRDRGSRLHGVPFCRLGRLIRYHVDELDGWLNQRRDGAV